MKARFLVLAIVFGLVSISPVLSDSVQVILGDQDFSDGSLLADAAAFNGPSAGEPAPFDSFKGSDYNADFSGSWTFNFSPGSYSSATITIGLFDADGSTQGDQVSFFGFDGNDMTVIAVGATNDFGVGFQLQYNVYSMTIPVAALADLSDGSATFTLTLQRGLEGPPGTSSGAVGGTSGDPAGSISSSGITLFNGAGLDFATLDATSPEPVTLDIKPGSDPNSINCNNDSEVITVAILTTELFSHSFLPHLLSHNLRASSACYFHYPAPKKTVFTRFSSRDPLASKKQTPICQERMD